MMSNRSFIIAVIVLLMTMTIAGVLSARPQPVVVRTNLENLPMEIAGYSGTDDSFPDSVYRVLNADKHVYRHYRTGDGRRIDLYIGYYGTAKGGRTGHNPYACLPGAGWAITDSGKVDVKLGHDESGATVNYVMATRDGNDMAMLHWYQTAGTKVVATGFRQNIERFLGRVLHCRNDGAYVQILTEVSDGSVLDAQSRLVKFAEPVLRLLPQYWPVEK